MLVKKVSSLFASSLKHTVLFFYPAIHKVKEISIVGIVVVGATPKKAVQNSPSSPVTMTLRWSLMMDFKHSQN